MIFCKEEEQEIDAFATIKCVWGAKRTPEDTCMYVKW